MYRTYYLFKHSERFALFFLSFFCILRDFYFIPNEKIQQNNKKRDWICDTKGNSRYTIKEELIYDQMIQSWKKKTKGPRKEMEIKISESKKIYNNEKCFGQFISVVMYGCRCLRAMLYIAWHLHRSWEIYPPAKITKFVRDWNDERELLVWKYCKL